MINELKYKYHKTLTFLSSNSLDGRFSNNKIDSQYIYHHHLNAISLMINGYKMFDDLYIKKCALKLVDDILKSSFLLSDNRLSVIYDEKTIDLWNILACIIMCKADRTDEAIKYGNSFVFKINDNVKDFGIYGEALIALLKLKNKTGYDIYDDRIELIENYMFRRHTYNPYDIWGIYLFKHPDHSKYPYQNLKKIYNINISVATSLVSGIIQQNSLAAGEVENEVLDHQLSLYKDCKFVKNNRDSSYRLDYIFWNADSFHKIISIKDSPDIIVDDF